ncbi:unnamed protein product [Vicia faba]|uniref:Uncharacterized protein n=1 Tax=Vicia faba TaxID=3906 RepID=A0AAV1BCD1_VICFA|nr:unnamed protein product [Vicia faba]
MQTEGRAGKLSVHVQNHELAGSMALAVFVSITVTGHAGYAGVGLNPARCLGPALLHGASVWNGHWVFWAGPFLACLVYYSVSINLPKEGLDWVDGEYAVLRLAMGFCERLSLLVQSQTILGCKTT